MNRALSDVSNIWQTVSRGKRNKRAKLSSPRLNPDAPEFKERAPDTNDALRVLLAQQARHGIIKTAFDCSDIIVGIHAKNLVSDMAMNPENYYGIDADELMFIQDSLIRLSSCLALES
jgi:hypothetical protein